MANDASATGPGRDAPEPGAQANDPGGTAGPAGAHPESLDEGADATERALRRISSRKGKAYDGPILAITRGWVSRDGRNHAFAARFLDFAMLTPDQLVFCSTGFFTRRPRRQVLREPLNRLAVVPIGPEPVRSLRIIGDFSRPLRLELRASDHNFDFVRQLLELTHREPRLLGQPTGDRGTTTDPPAAES